MMTAIFTCLAILLAADLAAAVGCTLSVNALRKQQADTAGRDGGADPSHTPPLLHQTPPAEPEQSAVTAIDTVPPEPAEQPTESVCVENVEQMAPIGLTEAVSPTENGSPACPEKPHTMEIEPIPVTEEPEPVEPLPVTEEILPEQEQAVRYAPVSDSTAVQAGPAAYGRAHNIGGRASQQDALGVVEFADGRGLLALVADGMGGLSGGERVSGQIVVSMMEYASGLQEGLMDEVLPGMVRQVNDEVNRMLGPEGLYKSGSTLVAVLVMDGMFHWISVGDSRIYLYRGGGLVQLNQEHTQLQEWMPEILNGHLSYEQAARHPDAGKLTSFIGMGRLRHVDASIHGIRICPQDRILLMSDGIFNTLPETEMARILDSCPDVQQAADLFEDHILRAKTPGQDNFTVVILGF